MVMADPETPRSLPHFLHIYSLMPSFAVSFPTTDPIRSLPFHSLRYHHISKPKTPKKRTREKEREEHQGKKSEKKGKGTTPRQLFHVSRISHPSSAAVSSHCCLHGSHTLHRRRMRFGYLEVVVIFLFLLS
jgi:hypothetical protein